MSRPNGIQGFGAGAPIDALQLLSHVEAMEKTYLDWGTFSACNSVLHRTGRPSLPTEVMTMIADIRYNMALNESEQPGLPGTATRATVALPSQDGLPRPQLIGTSIVEKWKLFLDCCRDMPAEPQKHLSAAEWAKYNHVIQGCAFCTNKAVICTHPQTHNYSPITTPFGTIDMMSSNTLIMNSVRDVRKRVLFLLNIECPRVGTIVPAPPWFTRVNGYLKNIYDLQMYFSYNDGSVTGGRPSIIAYLIKLSALTRRLTRSRKSNGKHPACAWRPPQFSSTTNGEAMRGLPFNIAQQIILRDNLRRCLRHLRLEAEAKIPHYDCDTCHHLTGSSLGVRVVAGTAGIVGPNNDICNGHVLSGTRYVTSGDFPQLFDLGGMHVQATGGDVRVSLR